LQLFNGRTSLLNTLGEHAIRRRQLSAASLGFHELLRSL
jgi:hypothetical protein